ncbi:ATP-binding protein [Desulfovibrionales bacterium]
MGMMNHYLELNKMFQQEELLSQLLEDSQAALIVVDQHRNVVFASQVVLDLAGATDIRQALGRAPGDVFQCVNANRSGCGKDKNCCDCGAFLAIRNGLNGDASDVECYMSIETKDKFMAKDFFVHAVPLLYKGEQYAILSLQDIGHEKRRRAFEQIFFHDIVNTVGAVKGLLQLLHDDLDGEHKELLGTVLPHFKLCVDEIKAQRKLLDAENNDLELNVELFSILELIQGLTALMRQSTLCFGKEIRVKADLGSDRLGSDRVLVHRICMNLIKNALEASSKGDVVSLEIVEQDSGFVVHVANPAYMPESVQHQIFHRSFTTKGPGRGLGTYSIHLLCTNYLRGRVWFETTPETGTVFSVFFPQLHGTVPAQPV